MGVVQHVGRAPDVRRGSTIPVDKRVLAEQTEKKTTHFIHGVFSPLLMVMH